MKKSSVLLLSLMLSMVAMAAEKPAVLAPMDLEMGGGAVKGSLVLPDAKGKVPVVLLIAGSGPTDRNGNSAMLAGGNDSLKMLAEGLGASGVASLRYDKRGIGASAKVPEAELRFDTYVADAVTWCGMLRNDERFSRVVIAGHSEGSLVGMLAARQCGADGFVSLAGAGRRAGEILRSQLAGKLPPALAERTEEILKSLETGKMVDSVPPELVVLFRASVQPYMASWMKHDPAKAVAELKVPVLIVQGTTDVQVTVEDAKRLAAANAKARLLLVDGMNHVLKSVPADMQKQIASYGDPSLPLATEVVPAIVELAMGPTAAR